MLSSSDMLRLSERVRPIEETATQHVIQETQRLVKQAAESGVVRTAIDVPAMIPGLPAYDYRTVCRGVRDAYVDGGFKVHLHALGQYTVEWATTKTEPDDDNGGIDDDTKSEVVRVVYS
tara:strand:+ start:511 stop:867 length:357 start_codon:yes stop_codon:yes gene_type:complete